MGFYCVQKRERKTFSALRLDAPVHTHTHPLEYIVEIEAFILLYAQHIIIQKAACVCVSLGMPPLAPCRTEYQGIIIVPRQAISAPAGICFASSMSERCQTVRKKLRCQNSKKNKNFPWTVKKAQPALGSKFDESISRHA